MKIVDNEKSIFLQRHSVPENGKIAIFGAGQNGKILHRLFKLFKINTDIFLDNNSVKHGSTVIDDVICYKPSNMLASSDEMLVIVTVQNNPNSIKEDLLNKGFRYVILMCDVENEFAKRIEEMIDDFGIDLVSYMAESGAGTDKCLDAGVFPMQVHFYQPIPDIKEIEQRNVWSKVSELNGITWEPDKFIANMQEIAQFQPEKTWAREPSKNTMEFCLENNSFSYICASFLYGMIRKKRPKRIIEVGSGNSSKVILKALTDNGDIIQYNTIQYNTIQYNTIQYNTIQYNTKYTIIDPYCAFEESNFAPFNVEIMRMLVEETDISLFKELEENDILFIDSSHAVKIGGDVNFEILDILPILAPGVVIHFHDIPMPYEYSKIYATNPKFRVFWTESYLLQAFLQFNSQYEILLPAAYLCTEKLEIVKECFPSMANPFDWSSGSFWIRRKI